MKANFFQKPLRCHRQSNTKPNPAFEVTLICLIFGTGLNNASDSSTDWNI